MLSLINWRLKVTINDGRAFVGQMLAFDRHMNLVLAECEEFRRVRPKKKAGETEAGPIQEMKRTLGLVILRGETVVSLSVEGPPPVTDEDKKNVVRRMLLVSSRAELIRVHIAAVRSWTRCPSRSWYSDDAPWCAYLLAHVPIIPAETLLIRCSRRNRAPTYAVCSSWDGWSPARLPSPWFPWWPSGHALPPSPRLRWTSTWVRAYLIHPARVI